MEALFLPLLFALTTAAFAWAGARALRLPVRALPAALLGVVEWAGLAVMAAALNLAAGFALALLLRRATGRFVSLYVNADVALLALSLLQAAALQWWMRGVEDDA